MHTAIKSYVLALMMAAILWAVCTPAWAESPEDILIVAHPAAPQKEIAEGEVRAIFLKKKTNWSSGQKIVAVHARAGTSLRNAFLKRVLQFEPDAEVSYFEAQKIRSGISPPVEFPNPLRAVFHLEGAIGYVFRKDFKAGVAKVLLVIPK